MPVKLFCPNPTCDASYGVDESILGRNVRCKKCGRKFVASDERSSPQSGETDPVPSGSGIDIPNPFGKYRVVKRLGRGGMGAVYLAFDDDLDRAVALKIPTVSGDHDAEIVERFKREAKAAASFHHPNFCPIYEAGKIGDRPYLAMAHVEGKELTALVHRDRPMNPRDAASLVARIARAMADAHDKGIIHRDLKPSNIMIDARGEPIIMDFGLARRAGSSDAELTASNAILGSIHYMSPEQVKNEKTLIGPATDGYSLGVILYELMAGRRPFEGPPTSVIAFILMNDPPSASDHRPGLDPALVAICQKAMNKSIPDRYASMRDFASALEAFVSPPSVSPSPASPPFALPVIDTSEPESRTPSPSRVLARPAMDRRLILTIPGGMAAVILGVILYIATDKGTLKIEGFDPTMEVRIDGKEVRVETLGEPITLRTGEHDLLIMQGDVRVKAPRSFVVTRGRETLVQVEFTPKEPTAIDPFAGRVAGDVKRLEIGSVEIVMCWCPAGMFRMGSPPGEAERDGDEGQVEVRLTRGFWMLRTEVTQELYQAVTGGNPSNFKGGKLPVEMVSHAEAVQFAGRLTAKLREAHALPTGWEIRLPTEAQWEYAARAGTTSPFPFGEALNAAQANFNGAFPYGGAEKGAFLATTREVGSYQPNAWGLHDTVGNVWEWTLDASEGKLPGGVDPFVAGMFSRVIRGGSWYDHGRSCRSAYRSKCQVEGRNSYLGFRLAAVRSIP